MQETLVLIALMAGVSLLGFLHVYLWMRIRREAYEWKSLVEHEDSYYQENTPVIDMIYGEA
tara:strand:+ start:274 stop:456 length:183 start_codon:yes stop_codon:yes gene_type:complete